MILYHDFSHLTMGRGGIRVMVWDHSPGRYFSIFLALAAQQMERSRPLLGGLLSYEMPSYSNGKAQAAFAYSPRAH